jgi:hypothetical protein
MPDHHRIQWWPSSKPVKDGSERFIRGQVAMKARPVEHGEGHRQHQPAAWRKCGGATQAGETERLPQAVPPHPRRLGHNRVLRVSGAF